ncbi:MAG: primosomal protein N' [Gemmatimonadota bacterium]
MARSTGAGAASSSLVDVALPLPLDRTFTYALPTGVSARVGARILVPFRRSVRVGWVVATDVRDRPRGLRAAVDVLDRTEPSLTPPLLRLARWISEYYLAPLGLVLRATLPALLSDHSRDLVVVDAETAPPAELTGRQRRVFDALRAAAGARAVPALAKELGLSSIWPEVRFLVDLELARHSVAAPREPAAVTRKVIRLEQWLDTLAEREALLARAPRQREAYQRLEDAGGELELSVLDQDGLAGAARALVGRGLARSVDVEQDRDPFADLPPSAAPALAPTARQRAVLEALTPALGTSRPPPFLLHGITGSGKTLVYIELLARARAEGRGAIVLVPEISLTPQTVARFRARFGDEVAVLHSGLSDGERYDAWRALREGRKRIAVGARSAVFAPIERLGVIVVDEEHEGTYKQSESPRYHARDVAVVRARLEGAVCLLGSATPALESWVNAERGKYTLLALPERVSGGALPPVEVVDLRTRKGESVRPARDEAEEPAARGEGGLVLSPPLIGAVRTRLARGEQSILLLNRRGYSSFLQCEACGFVVECPECSVSMTFHRARGRVVCHHCGREEAAPRTCPRCLEGVPHYRGIGTEQVERVVAQTFAGARIARMDLDTTSGKWAHHRILERVGRGEIDILLGTQMIAKGLDFPNVTLVGVINADVGLHLPDFRASERTFQLLSQVAGRAGRGPKGGQVLIQSAVPGHYVIQAALRHDYEGFARQELAERRSAAYPPFVRLVNVVVSSPDQARAAEAAEHLAARILARLARGPSSTVRLTGPAPSPIERLHGRWRWHFLLRGPAAELGRLARETAGSEDDHGDVRIVFDRDPVALL